jgi:ABC-type Fe3+-hydroxamate transport system substrate-binding protein
MGRALLLAFAFALSAWAAEPPGRVASYSPGATKTLVALGVGERIVAATRWCPLPATHRAVRNCDAFNPDLEALLQTKPDLVILPRLANPLWAERCERAGLRTLVLNAESADSAPRDIALIAGAVGKRTEAARILDQPTPPTRPTRTLLIIWDGMMAGPDAYTAWPLKQAGLRSPLPAGTWVKLDWETLIQAAPDAILWLESAPEDTPITRSEKHQKELSEVVVVKELKSVKSGNIYHTQSGSDWLPGAGLAQAAQKLQAIRKDLP